MKRFTETNKWKDVWFRKLPYLDKIVWIYLIDNCDNAGFIELDIELMAFTIGATIEEIRGAVKGLSRGYLGSKEKDNEIWIINFLSHQKNLPLNPLNNAHKQIINMINTKLSSFPEIIKKTGAKKGLFSPIGKGIGKGKGKEGIVKGSENIEKIYQAYPRKESKPTAIAAIEKAITKIDSNDLFDIVNIYAEKTKWKEKRYIPLPATWFNQEKWLDDQTNWEEPTQNKISSAKRNILDDFAGLTDDEIMGGVL